MLKTFVSIPELPSKTLGRILAPSHLEVRRASLDQFLKLLTCRRDTLTSPLLYAFLGIDDMCPDLAARAFCQTFNVQKLSLEDQQFIQRKSNPCLIGTLRDPNFGVKKAFYIQEKGLLLSACNDFSFASKVDAFVSATLSTLIPTDSLIPLSRFCVWKVTLRSEVNSYTDTPIESSQTSSICLRPFQSNSPRKYKNQDSDGGLNFELVYVQYYSRRMSSLVYLALNDSVYVGFETGDLLCYSLGPVESHPVAPCSSGSRYASSSAEDCDSIINAFHDETDGRHVNRIVSEEDFVSQYDLSTPEEKTASRQIVCRQDLPLLPQFGSSVIVLEIFYYYNKPLLFIAAAEGVCQVYELEGKKPWGTPIGLNARARCVAGHPTLPIIAIGLTDGTIGIYHILENESLVPLGEADARRVTSRLQRVEFVHFIDVAAQRDKGSECLHSFEFTFL
eukprot:Gregarina_sp_Poly_1__5963@NODE_313_length_9615_cov_112_161500_g268_i0_p4_GENE_NODE_313_length_9615_cov_112_161500_g268_i0NODE_313_length_9615_cov_112_161500_g268_i0_p4_ORF_typecomplete_len448_score62_81ANAPC4_WD40/PF12894_7/6_5e05PX/PF00787_24/0_0033_NODE_313_length_9615_cov_112_161500_g268_i021523495